MALRTVTNVPGISTNKHFATKGTLAIGKGPLTRKALGDIQNQNPKSRLPIATKSNSSQVGKLSKDKPTLKSFQLPNIHEDFEVKAPQASFSSGLLPSDVVDVDKDDSGNPQLCSDYVMDIFEYLRHLEVAQGIEQDFLRSQTEVTSRMRTILVDWLVQVHERFHLLQETLYLTICFLDRFLQKQLVSKSNLQLLGVSAMFLASKYEEMYAPEVNDFVYITDNAYKKKEIFKMESAILRTLNFDLGRPLPLHFLRRYSKVAECDAAVHTLAKYLLELCLPEYAFAHFRPSILAAAALFLSLKCLDNAPWNPVLTYYTRYSEDDLRDLVRAFANLLLNSGKAKLQAVRKKYACSKLLNISLLPELTSTVVKELAQ